MKRAGILVLAGALVATVVAAAGPTREWEGDFGSQAIGGTLHYVVYLPAGGDWRRVLGFEAGPCNVLLDALMRQLTAGREKVRGLFPGEEK